MDQSNLFRAFRAIWQWILDASALYVQVFPCTKPFPVLTRMISTEIECKIRNNHPQAEQKSEESTRSSSGTVAVSSSIHFRYVCTVKHT